MSTSGEVLVAECNIGYELEEGNLTCQIGGTWDGLASSCESKILNLSKYNEKSFLANSSKI